MTGLNDKSNLVTRLEEVLNGFVKDNASNSNYLQEVRTVSSPISDMAYRLDFSHKPAGESPYSLQSGVEIELSDFRKTLFGREKGRITLSCDQGVFEGTNHDSLVCLLKELKRATNCDVSAYVLYPYDGRHDLFWTSRFTGIDQIGYRVKLDRKGKEKIDTGFPTD